MLRKCASRKLTPVEEDLREEFGFFDAANLASDLGANSQQRRVAQLTTARAGLVLNVDWFSKFKRTTQQSPGLSPSARTLLLLICCKIGNIMMVFMNLPSELRYRPEYVLHLGTVPGER